MQTKVFITFFILTFSISSKCQRFFLDTAQKKKNITNSFKVASTNLLYKKIQFFDKFESTGKYTVIPYSLTKNENIENISITSRKTIRFEKKFDFGKLNNLQWIFLEGKFDDSTFNSSIKNCLSLYCIKLTMIGKEFCIPKSLYQMPSHCILIIKINLSESNYSKLFQDLKEFYNYTKVKNIIFEKEDTEPMAYDSVLENCMQYSAEVARVKKISIDFLGETYGEKPRYNIIEKDTNIAKFIYEAYSNKNIESLELSDERDIPCDTFYVPYFLSNRTELSYISVSTKKPIICNVDFSELKKLKGVKLFAEISSNSFNSSIEKCSSLEHFFLGITFSKFESPNFINYLPVSTDLEIVVFKEIKDISLMYDLLLSFFKNGHTKSFSIYNTFYPSYDFSKIIIDNTLNKKEIELYNAAVDFAIRNNAVVVLFETLINKKTDKISNLTNRSL